MAGLVACGGNGNSFVACPCALPLPSPTPTLGYWPFALYHRRRRHRVRRIADSIANLTGKAGV